MARQIENIVITGFSGTGKSIVAGRVAASLGWVCVDTDELIAGRAGRPIAEIFAQDGEERFRELEREVVREVSERRCCVIALGGGAVVDPRNREVVSRNGMLVCLEARSDTINGRLFRGEAGVGDTEVRPLLAGDDRSERVKRLKAERQSAYAEVDWTVHTDYLDVGGVAAEVVRAWELLGPLRAGRVRVEGCGAMQERVVSCGVTRPPSDYRILVGYGLVDRLGWEMRELGLSGTTVVVSDDAVFPQYGARVQNALESEGFAVKPWVVPRGEGTKCLAWAERTYDFMVEQRVERGDCVVALGGGMVGDLAGFVAATFLRGISLVQVPTSLVAMVDASIGGKVGVNHPLGKNLIGAFYQPKLVVVDPGCLGTLPGRELRSGWAEVVKYGAIQDGELFEVLGSSAESLMELETEAVIEAVARSAAIKARIVEEDEREAGKRMILNYGHSIGHGLEAATGYSQFLHGEAVAVGMTGAAMLSERMGLLPAEAARRQQRVLKRFGLPTGFTGVGVGDVVKAMELDKKVREGSLRWVLLEDIGRSVVRRDVPRDMVLGVLEDLSGG